MRCLAKLQVSNLERDCLRIVAPLQLKPTKLQMFTSSTFDSSFLKLVSFQKLLHSSESVKPIKDFPNYYVTDIGRVFSNKTHYSHWRNPRTSLVPYELRPVTEPRGYKVVGLANDSMVITKSVHRLVLETFVGLPPEGMECWHHDGNPANNQLENLRWDTHSANMRDAGGPISGVENSLR